VELAEQILQNCGLARVALGRRRRVKEMAEKLGRVAQVLQRDAQRVPLLRSERPEMPPALANLSVQPVEALCGEADGWLLEPAKTVLRRPAPPAALRHDMFEDKREARRPLVCGEPENRRAACLGLRLRRAQKAVEPRLVGKTRKRTGAKRLNEHVPVARLAEDRGDPSRLGPQVLEVRARKDAAEQAERRPQPAHRDAHLMDGFGAVAGRERGQIAEEMAQTVVQERADRLVERRLRRQRRGMRADQLRQLVRQEAPCALGLALDAECDGQRLDHLKTVSEQRGGPAGLELELDFAERLASLAGEEEAGIECDLDGRAP